MPAKAYYVTSY